jgi:hypothetical protein
MSYRLIAIALTTLIIWYITRLYITIKKRGLDPTLATYLSPLSLKSMLGARLCYVAALLSAALLPHAVNIPAVLLLTSALLHVAILAAYGRLGTQPYGYYLLLAAVGGLLIPQARTTLIAAIIVTIAAELYLRRWRATQKVRYNAWVAANVRRIARRHREVRGTMTDTEWFHVLHFATTEHIARPRLVRIAEYVYFYAKRPAMMSTGIMQVMASHPLSDQQSMAAGAKIVQEGLRSMPATITDPHEQLMWLARHYNGSTSYSKYLKLTYPGMVQAWKSIQKST